MAASSSASVFASADTDARSTVDSPRFWIGSFTDDEVDIRIAPPPRATMEGTAARTMRSALNSSRSTAPCHAASSNESAAPAGGPPPLANSRSTPPNVSSVARVQRRMPSADSTSSGVASTCSGAEPLGRRRRSPPRRATRSRRARPRSRAPAPPRSRARGSRPRPSRLSLSVRDPCLSESRIVSCEPPACHACFRPCHVPRSRWPQPMPSRDRAPRASSCRARRRAPGSPGWRARRAGAALPCGSPSRSLPGTRSASAARRDRRRPPRPATLPAR